MTTFLGSECFHKIFCKSASVVFFCGLMSEHSRGTPFFSEAEEHQTFIVSNNTCYKEELQKTTPLIPNKEQWFHSLDWIYP